uniref:Endonuclease n=1 Tax=feces metagenome TaxID=1861841 RepID=A0A2I2K960_9ZZZZ
MEVKSRSRNIQAPPQYSVDARKRRNITKAAACFLRTSRGLPYSNMECLFDIAAVVFSEESVKVDLLEHAYIPLYF